MNLFQILNISKRCFLLCKLSNGYPLHFSRCISMHSICLYKVNVIIYLPTLNCFKYNVSLNQSYVIPLILHVRHKNSAVPAARSTSKNRLISTIVHFRRLGLLRGLFSDGSSRALLFSRVLLFSRDMLYSLGICGSGLLFLWNKQLNSAFMCYKF